MEPQTRSDRAVLASYAGPRAFAARARAALHGLGYDVVAAATRGRFDDPSWRPALRIADERHLERLPDPEADPDTPIILLSGLRPRRVEDPRVVGQIQRPAELVPLYQLIQRTLEDTPRRTPRVATQLSARCIGPDRRMVGAVVSLSEHGCLFRSAEPLHAGARLSLQFAIPGAGVVSTRAECVRHEGRDAGLNFSGTPVDTRRSICHFVVDRLAATA